MRRRRDAIVLAVSLIAHVALLTAWIRTRSDLTLAESPTLEVQLVRLPPKPAAEPRKPPPPKPHNPSPPPDIHPPASLPPAPSASPQISPDWTVKPEGPSAADLAAAPFASGRARARPPARRPSCKTLPGSWDRPASCPPDAAEIAASKADAAKDSRTAGFEAAGRYTRAAKRYQELPGDAGYPGIGCAIFHRC